jgi:hypothetical protein
MPILQIFSVVCAGVDILILVTDLIFLLERASDSSDS